jgi:nicotinamidase-related amidase
MQRYFTEPSFPFTDAFEKMSPGMCSGYLRRVREIVIPSIQRLLDQFRQNDCTIVFTTVGSNAKDGSDTVYGRNLVKPADTTPGR